MSDNKVMITGRLIEQEFQVGDSKIRVLNTSNFSIQEKTFNIIFGPSGSGKSTLLNILSGIQKPTRGQVLFNNEDIYGYSAEQLAYFRAKRIGVVYQQNYWVNSLNVLENVSVPLFFLGHSRHSAAKIAMDMLQRVDMATFAKKSPLVLSGGEQQRIAIARAIVNDPDFIIADEPTGSLDSKNGDMVMSLLNSYNLDLGRTIILVTHNMEYLPLADHLIHVQDGNSQEMVGNDIKVTTKTLIQQMNERIERLSTVKRRG